MADKQGPDSSVVESSKVGVVVQSCSHIFGLSLSRANFEQARALLLEDALRGCTPARVVVTPNVNHVVRLHRDQELFSIYCEADYMFADGMPIVAAARLLGDPVGGRVPGSDLFVALCADLDAAGGKLFLLGGRPGEETSIKATMKEKYPSLGVEVFSPSMSFDWQGSEAVEAVERVSRSEPDAVAVCVSFPKQERFAISHRRKINASVVLCVGAALDFVLGREKRAPSLVGRLGLEWLWRLALSPKRLWRRYLFDAPAFFRLFISEVTRKLLRTKPVSRG